MFVHCLAETEQRIYYLTDPLNQFTIKQRLLFRLYTLRETGTTITWIHLIKNKSSFFSSHDIKVNMLTSALNEERGVAVCVGGGGGRGGVIPGDVIPRKMCVCACVRQSETAASARGLSA